MTVHWGALLAVLAASFTATLTVVVLVTVALLGLSARTARPALVRVPHRPPLFSPAAGTRVAVVCLGLAALVVAFGLWTVVAT
jgi:hypothetical protein